MDLSHLRTFRAVAADLNGQLRGKRLPARVTALPFRPSNFRK